ncbi:uncharacterized protein LOC119436977 [Dermacentor silvarum]|uniref:uncharacterized protein LOC119436977 n=1 Tax=Dermacentor silvarum TaxID=543639 RepID=UPI00210084C8|nr:uncharacterized protein LOC119436977 [Dermacentor silvarum]
MLVPLHNKPQPEVEHLGDKRLGSSRQPMHNARGDRVRPPSRRVPLSFASVCFVTSAVLRFFADGLLPQWGGSAFATFVLDAPLYGARWIALFQTAGHLGVLVLAGWRDLIIVISDVCFAAWIDKTWAEASIQERTSIWLYHHRCLAGACRMTRRRVCLPVSARTFMRDLRQKAFVGSQCSPTKTGLLWLRQQSSRRSMHGHLCCYLSLLLITLSASFLIY